MGSFSIWHLLILGAVVLLLFGGKGKISDIMGDFAKGIKSFKKGLADDETPAKLDKDTFATLSPAGVALLDAAVDWAAGRR